MRIQKIGTLLAARSNRTFMELKSFRAILGDFFALRSNRTFMELKWARAWRMP